MAAEPGPDPGPNPFSFREFVRSQARGARGGPGPLLLPDPGEEEEQEEDEEEEWGGSYQPSAVERAHVAAGSFCEAPLGAPPRPGYEEVSAAGAPDRLRAAAPLRRGAKPCIGAVEELRLSPQRS